MYYIKKHKILILVMLLSGIILYSCSDSIPGDDSAFNPIASLPEAFEFAKSIDKVPDYTEDESIYLLSISAKYVKPDGTMDFEEEAYDAECKYTFVKKIKPEAKENLPLGVNNPNNTTIENAKLMNVTMVKPWDEEYIDEDGTTSYVHYRGVKKSYQIALWSDKYEILKTEQPLSFRTIWEKAIDAGAPSENVVAVIKYNWETGYTFGIQFTDHKYSFNKKGELIK